jgi:hypothetical protein
MTVEQWFDYIYQKQLGKDNVTQLEASLRSPARAAVGPVDAGSPCYLCMKVGHWARDCPTHSTPASGRSGSPGSARFRTGSKGQASPVGRSGSVGRKGSFGKSSPDPRRDGRSHSRSPGRPGGGSAPRSPRSPGKGSGGQRSFPDSRTRSPSRPPPSPRSQGQTFRFGASPSRGPKASPAYRGNATGRGRGSYQRNVSWGSKSPERPAGKSRGKSPGKGKSTGKSPRRVHSIVTLTPEGEEIEEEDGYPEEYDEEEEDEEEEEWGEDEDEAAVQPTP